MRLSARQLFFGASSLAIGLIAAPVMAQDDAGTQASDANDIIVTARRTEERLQDVPISITVFNQAQLNNRNVVSAGDLATYTPSLTSNGRFGSESTSFAIRGFIQEGPTSPSVGVYFAEVVGPRANGGSTGGNGAGPGSFFDLQNVQVLKGPQGTLFGRNTTGGAVLLVPHKPTGELEGYVEGSIGNYDLRRGQAVLNIPLADTFKVRLGVDRQKREGYLRNISPIGPDDFADVNYTAVRLSIVADLTPDLENYTIATYSKTNTHGFLPKPVVVPAGPGGSQPANTFQPVGYYDIPGNAPSGYRAQTYVDQLRATRNGYYDVSNGNPYAGLNIEQWQVINTTTWQASDSITLKNIISYAEFQQRQSTNIYGENGYDPVTGRYNYTTSIFSAPGDHNLSQSTFTDELQIQGRAFDDRLTYQVGGYVEISNPLGGRYQTTYSPSFINCLDVFSFQCTDVRGQQTPNGQGGTLEGRVGAIQISRSKYWFRNYGVYAQGTYKLTDQLSLTAGIRYTWDETRGLGSPYRVNFPAANTPSYSCTNPAGIVQGGTPAQVQADLTRCDIRREAKSKRPTWLIDLDYKPIDEVLLYAKWARGYRQGSINVTSYGLEAWGPEKVDTYELGAKTSFRGFIEGTFNIAAFYNDFSNQQIQANVIACATISQPQCPFIPSSAAGIANAGKSTIKGVEVEASARLFEGFRVDVGYTYLDAKIKKITAPATPPGFSTLILPLPGDAIALTPKHKVSVSAAYTLPLDESIGAITLSGTYTYQSGTFGSGSSVRSNLQFLPSQQNVNANLNWNSVLGQPIDASLFVTNLTKEKYHTFTTGASFGFDSIITNQPRMYGVRLKYRFGN